MTPKQKRDYLNGQYNTCPFCGSNDISAEYNDIESNLVLSDVLCLNCNEEWVDQYILSDVYQEEE